MIFACIWQYEVKPDCVNQFEQVYCENGNWTKLFSKSEGYIRTELLRDSEIYNRYITIDYWDSEDSFNSFRVNYKTEYEILDKKCHDYTDSEIKIGNFFLNTSGK